jgi:hypothetical protein
MSFEVNHRGIVYERDLCDETSTLASRITAYDPGDGWEPTLEE